MAAAPTRAKGLTNGNGLAEASARDAGLRYVTDARPGIRRRRSGRGFAYIASDGGVVREPETLARIRSLAIPPAWTDVWICPNARGHVQATGRDARGRKQYRYHPRWREVRDETKYGRLIAFAEALPRIRARVDRDLALRGLPRERILATVVRLLETTLIRVGNHEYARDNESFGLTTMRDRHVEVSGETLRFEFTGKAGKSHAVDVRDPRVARIVKRCQDLPGYELFQYVGDDGDRSSIESADVNAYLREIAGDDFTAKDFRTWGGTVLAVRALKMLGAATSQRSAGRKFRQAIEAVAAEMGNTPAISRACYLHPDVEESYLEGSLLPSLERKNGSRRSTRGLDPDEAEVLAFLRYRRRRRSSGNGRRTGFAANQAG